MTEEKKMTNEEIQQKVRAFMEEMSKDHGVKMNVQYYYPDGDLCSSVSTLSTAKALGAAELALEIFKAGIKAHNFMDILAQTMDTQPEISKRIMHAMEKAIQPKDDPNFIHPC